MSKVVPGRQSSKQQEESIELCVERTDMLTENIDVRIGHTSLVVHITTHSS